MGARGFVAVSVSWALVVSSVAGAAVVPVVGAGTTLGVDPYVADYQRTMTELTSQMTALGAQVKKLDLPPSARGIASGLSTLKDKLGAMDALKAQANASYEKMLAHMSRMPAGPHALGRAPRAAAFAAKQDAAVAPRTDTTLRRAEAGAAPMTSPQAPRLRALSSRFGYDAAMGGVGSGFSKPLAGGTPSAFGLPSGAPQVGSVSPTVSSGRESDYSAPPPAAGGQAATPGGAIGASAGTPRNGGTPAGGAGLSSGGGGDAPVKSAANPPAEVISVKKSDVAKVAQDRADKKAEEAKQEADQQRQEAQQNRQMQMQMLMQLAQMAAQLAQAAEQKKQQDKKEKQQRQQQAKGSGQQSAAASRQAFDQGLEQGRSEVLDRLKETQQQKIPEAEAAQQQGPEQPVQAPASSGIFSNLW